MLLETKNKLITSIFSVGLPDMWNRNNTRHVLVKANKAPIAANVIMVIKRTRNRKTKRNSYRHGESSTHSSHPSLHGRHMYLATSVVELLRANAFSISKPLKALTCASMFGK
jgi:hypothetical protein